MKPAAFVLVLLGSVTTAHASDPRDLSDEELDAALEEAEDLPLPERSEPPPALGPDGTYGRYTDVRFRYSEGSGSWSADLEPLGILVSDHRDGRIDRDRSFRLDLAHSGGLRPGGGWFWGVGLEYGAAHGTLMTDDAQRSLYAAHLIGGVAKPFGSKLQLELALIDQLGYGSIRDSFPGASTPVLSGAHLGLGAEANLVYTDISGWQLALTAGGRYFELHAKNADMYKAKTTGTSTGLGVFLGKRY